MPRTSALPGGARSIVPGRSPGSLILAALAFILTCAVPAAAQQPFIGQIKLFAGNFAPQGWMLCNGQLLPIAQYDALFNLIGTTYGGDGVTTFALPDLRGRVPIHVGQGPGLSGTVLGERGGSEVVTVTTSQLPQHTHLVSVSAAPGTSESPANGVPSEGPDGIPAYGGAASGTLNPSTVAVSGGSQPHNNVKPYTVVNYIIAVEGIFPTPN